MQQLQPGDACPATRALATGVVAKPLNGLLQGANTRGINRDAVAKREHQLSMVRGPVPGRVAQVETRLAILSSIC